MKVSVDFGGRLTYSRAGYRNVIKGYKMTKKVKVYPI